MTAHQEPTAIVVLVPEAEAAVGDWRLSHTGDGAAGMPAHVTLLFPFAPADQIDLDGLQAVAADTERFEFSLCVLCEWPDGVVYLAPRPVEPFVRLTQALIARFPSYPPYRGIHDEIVPHLTVVHTDDAGARADAAASVAGALPIDCGANEIWLMHEVNGRWQRHTSFPLGR